METEFQLSNNGQEVQKGDLNLVASEAAHSSDWLLAELLRTSTPSAANTPHKYVIPGGARREEEYPGGQKPLITSSGSNNHKLRIYPFTAVVGSLDDNTVDLKKALRNIRTVGHYGTLPNLYTEIQLPLATQNRWDLVCAKVDVDVGESPVNRFQKIGAGAANTVSVVVNKNTQISFVSVQGTETAGTPTRPSAPSDSASTFYIPLAYVKVPGGDTLTTIITDDKIFETYDAIGISNALGGGDIRPAKGCWDPSGFNTTEGLWTARPASFLPPGMVGKVERFIPLHCADSGHGTAAIPPNGSTTIDGSIDWRRRLFKIQAHACDQTGYFPWEVGASVSSPSAWQSVTSSHSLLRAPVMGNSMFNHNLGASIPVTSAVIGLWSDNVNSSPQLATGAVVALYVDMLTGALKVWRNNVNAGTLLMLWLEATGNFYNQLATGD